MGRARVRVRLLLTTVVIAPVMALAVAPPGNAVLPLTAAQVRAQASPKLAARAAVAPTCADDLLIAASGGGEGGTTHPAKIGVTAGSFATAYRAEQAKAGRSVQLEVVDATFANAAVLRPRTQPNKAANKYVTKAMALKWRSGVAAAASRTAGAMVTAASACPEQNIVLVGYSQGAMAVHRAILAVRSHPSVLARVLGVVLISDGNRDRYTAVTNPALLRPPRSARGIDDVRVAHFADLAFAPLKGKVWSMCRNGDVVCDYGPTRAATAIKISRTYHTGAAVREIRSLATGIAVRSQQVPQVSSTPVVVSTKVNSGVSVQLTAQVNAAAQSRLRWTATSGIPPGLTITSTGLLRGVPNTAGTWAMHYTVHNSGSATYDRAVPGTIDVTVTASNAADLAAGGQDSCVVRTDGTLWCWGLNTWGQVGDRTKTNRSVPTRMGTGVTWASVSTSGSHTCGTNRAGSLYCWGLNNYGQLGDGTKTSSVAAKAVVVGTQKWLSVSTSWFQTCAITTSHQLYCWGMNNEGQLGDGTKTTRLKPTRVGTGSNWATVSSGGWSGCATQTTGTLWCWGANDFGQVGDGTTTARLKPVQVGTATTWARASVGWLHACGYTATGFALCWGYNQDGEVGDGTTTNRLTPVNVGFAGPWVDVSVGDSFSCGVRADGTSLCWGDNTTGQLGSGDLTARPTPAQVDSSDSWAQVANGFSHTCGVTLTGDIRCWGINDAGQLGDGTGSTRLTPVTIAN